MREPYGEAFVKQIIIPDDLSLNLDFHILDQICLKEVLSTNLSTVQIRIHWYPRNLRNKTSVMSHQMCML